MKTMMKIDDCESGGDNDKFHDLKLINDNSQRGQASLPLPHGSG